VPKWRNGEWRAVARFAGFAAGHVTAFCAPSSGKSRASSDGLSRLSRKVWRADCDPGLASTSPKFGWFNFADIVKVPDLKTIKKYFNPFTFKIMKEISKKVLHFILLSLNFIYIIYNTVQYNLYNKFTIIKFNLQYRCMYISNLLHNFLTVDFETNK
jgi:hypothetical protein